MEQIDTLGPAMVFSLAEILGDELEARGWTTDDLARAMGADPVNYAIAPLLISIQKDMNINDDIFASLAKALDVSEQFLRNIDDGWKRWPDRQQDYSAPDKLYGPIGQRMYRLRDNDNEQPHQ